MLTEYVDTVDPTDPIAKAEAEFTDFLDTIEYSPGPVYHVRVDNATKVQSLLLN